MKLKARACMFAAFIAAILLSCSKVDSVKIENAFVYAFAFAEELIEREGWQVNATVWNRVIALPDSLNEIGNFISVKIIIIPDSLRNNCSLFSPYSFMVLNATLCVKESGKEINIQRENFILKYRRGELTEFINPANATSKRERAALSFLKKAAEKIAIMYKRNNTQT